MTLDPRQFRQRSRKERIQLLLEEGILTPSEANKLLQNQPVLPLEIAEHMIENVVGVFGLPLALVPGVLVNGKLYDVPMVIEEPSVVAAQAHAAKIMRQCGGYQAESTDPIMIAQVQLVGVEDTERARREIELHKEELMEKANAAMPGVVRRGGGIKRIEVREIVDPEFSKRMIVVHYYLDTRDAMGANAINTVAEKTAPLLEEWSQGEAVLRILSNYATERRAKARVEIPVTLLATSGFTGEEVARRIVDASRLAELDPYRAATHNKGFMNGVDAVLIATGNDFRAVEAGAHAYAARNGSYSALSRWRFREGKLIGEAELPMAVGIVGGQTRSHPWVSVLLRIMGVKSARELAEVIVSVGLGQNFAALRALVTEGIQRGHMAMHARAVALAAGAQPREMEAVVERLRHRGEITPENARKILEELRKERVKKEEGECR